MKSSFSVFACLALSCSAIAAERFAPCRIEVVEKGSGWPVPLVELRTVHGQKWVTDNAGVIACDAPEVFGLETWFYVTSPGYGVKPDGFKMRGVRLKPEAGGSLKVEVEREIIAKRIGRITGAGIFGESQKLGDARDWVESGVFGCDSVQSVVYRDKLFWLWGDTLVARYPLGVFNSSGGFSSVRPVEKAEPPLKLKIDILRDDQGVARGISPMKGDGPTWMFGVIVLPDKAGQPRLVGNFCKVRGYLEAYQRGLCVWNDEKKIFDLVKVFWTKSAESPKPQPFPDGNGVLWRDAVGKEWALFGNPFPNVRCPATFEAWQDPGTWEPIEAPASVTAAKTGEKVKPHTGCIGFHPWRKRWVAVFSQSEGKPSPLGELWYAEADAPTGPWGPAVKVLTHDNYTFYNPRLHIEWTTENSPVLLFEGTYTDQFLKKPTPTARYDYNQILYRLDLDDPALKPAQGK